VRRYLLPPLVLVAYAAGVLLAVGWLDVLRPGVGPLVPLALPLREAGHADGVGLVTVVVVGLSLALLGGLLVRPRRPLVAAAARALAVLASALAVAALSIELVRQASLGFDWRAAFASAGPWLLAACTFAGTLGAWLAARSLSRERP
jgi:hypothetical protein